MRSLLLTPRVFALALSMTGLVALLLASCGGPTGEGTPTRPNLSGPTPTELGLVIQAGNAVAASVELGNEGTADLAYQVAGLPAWMSGDALAGTIAPGAAATVGLTARCEGAERTRSATLVIDSNDPAQPRVELPVALTCEAPPDDVPVAAFTATPQQGVAPLEVTLDAGDAHDPEGPISAYEWDLGDGTTADGETHTHTFEEPGAYEVTLLVRDEAGQEDTAVVTVRVSPPDAVPPTARIEASPASGTARAPLTVTFTADAEDPDGTVTDLAWTVQGDAYSGGEVEHTFGDAGTFEVELVVTDDDGATARASASYEVLPDLYAVPEAVTFDLGASPPTLRIASTGDWTLSSDAAWLDAQPVAGGTGSSDVTLEVTSEGDLSGTEGTATLTLEGDGDLVEVPVTLRLPDFGGVVGAPVELDATLGSGASGGFAVDNAGRAPLAVSASSGQGWIDVSPATATAAAGRQASFDVTAECGTTEESRQGQIDLSFDDPDEPSATVQVTLMCQEAASTGAYQIELIYYGDETPSSSQRQVFQQAATRWTEAIIGDLPDVTVPEGTALCGSDLPRYGGTIDDLVVFVGLFDIDGPGGVLGRAGPCAMRSSSLLPFAGLVELDIGDVDALESDGLLEDTAMHELGHVLGIGTLWHGSHDLVDPACPSNDPASRFIGVDATHAHELDGGLGSPYVEMDGATGTRCGHWDEDRYGHELMTGFLNRGEALARFTIGSLADLGYEVDYGAADAYTVGAHLRGADAGFELREVLVDPSMFQER